VDPNFDPGIGGSASGLFPSLKVLDPAYLQQKYADYQAQAAVAAAAGQTTRPDSPPSPTLGQRFVAWVEAHPGEVVLIGVAALFAASKL